MGIRDSEQRVKSEFTVDEDGNPTGGTTSMVAPGAHPHDEHVAIEIHWQKGMIGPEGQNGAFIEDVLEAARQRLLFFNTTKFRCRENSVAITKIEEALQWLDWRTRQRLLQDMENTYEVHDG